MTLSNFSWYYIANVEVPEFKMNSSALKVIEAKYREKARQRAQGKTVRVPGFQEFTALSAGSEIEPEGHGESQVPVPEQTADIAAADARSGDPEQVIEAAIIAGVEEAGTE